MTDIEIGKPLVGYHDLTLEQMDIIEQIHKLARQMEAIKNTGKVHYRIALIEELSKQPTAWDYMQEKLEGLFKED